MEAGEIDSAFPPKRLLHENKHFVERALQDLNIVGSLRSLDETAEVGKRGHLIHAVLRGAALTVMKPDPAGVKNSCDITSSQASQIQP
jgi:hypothetical protein